MEGSKKTERLDLPHAWPPELGSDEPADVFKEATFNLKTMAEINERDSDWWRITDVSTRKKLSPNTQTSHSSQVNNFLWVEDMFHVKQINDGAVHGHLRLPDYCIEFIDTPQFQRLRDLKQLGTSYYVFPGASHNRFEHCLGVAHLSGTLLERFAVGQPELGIDERDLRAVRLAGLCHDIGHGPLSHAFEEWVKKATWVTPEQMSLKMVDYLIDDNGLDYSRDDIRYIQSLITGEPLRNREEKRFIYEIVANRRNSIDVDKFDYIARDCANVGMVSGFDFRRVTQMTRVINDEICYYSKGDAMTLADEYIPISKSLNDIAQYSLMTDSIIKEIERSTTEELEASRAIIRDIRRRKHYKLVGNCIVPVAKMSYFPLKVSEEEIITYQSKGALSLQPSDIIVQDFAMNYAMGDQNPVDNVHFFSKWNEFESFPIAKQEVSMLMPENFSERYIRIFCRRQDPQIIEAARSAFRNYLTQFGCKPIDESRLELPRSPRRPSYAF